MPEARLIDVRTPERPAGAVLVLHGGGQRPGHVDVTPSQLSVLRMVPVARGLARAGRGRLAVHRLLNTYRGWDARHTPVEDVRWALDQVRREHPDVPVALVGHSLGGRAALLAGGEDGVRCVVALNPWVYPDDTADLRGRRVRVVHGDADRVADLRRAETVVHALRRTTQVELVVVPGGKHAMLAHAGTYQRLTEEFVVATLLG